MTLSFSDHRYQNSRELGQSSSKRHLHPKGGFELRGNYKRRKNSENSFSQCSLKKESPALASWRAQITRGGKAQLRRDWSCLQLVLDNKNWGGRLKSLYSARGAGKGEELPIRQLQIFWERG